MYSREIGKSVAAPATPVASLAREATEGVGGLTGHVRKPRNRGAAQSSIVAMKVLFYGKLASALGPRLDVPLSGPCSVEGLRRHLIAAYPQIAEALQDQRVRAVIGDRVVGDDHALGMQDEVEFLAPVSGG